MIDLIYQAILYVTGDLFFWPSMAFTTMVGIFIGAVVYDGDTKQIQKFLVSLFSYVVILLTVNLTRVIPEIQIASVPHKQIAAAVTTLVVTLFYLLGMTLGVKLVKHAHRGRVEL